MSVIIDMCNKDDSAIDIFNIFGVFLIFFRVSLKIFFLGFLITYKFTIVAGPRLYTLPPNGATAVFRAAVGSSK